MSAIALYLICMALGVAIGYRSARWVTHMRRVNSRINRDIEYIRRM